MGSKNQKRQKILPSFSVILSKYILKEQKIQKQKSEL
jgi:hypothetical protein